MATHIVASVVFLAAGASIFEQWHEQAQEERWQRVGNICLKALAQAAVETRDGLMLLLSGRLPFPEEHPRGRFDSDMAQTIVARAARGNGSDPWSPRRFDALMQDGEWVRFAYAAVRQLASSMRDTVGEWAPLMVDSDRLCGEITRLAHLGDTLEDIHRPLGPSHRSSAGEVRDDCRDATAELLQRTTTFAVLIEERLVTTMGRRKWQTRGRELLGPNGANEVAAIDAGQLTLKEFEESVRAQRDNLRGRFPSAYETRQRAQPTQL